jgi:hypothetical protein
MYNEDFDIKDYIMINYIVGYGLLLTNPQGKAFAMYEQVVAAIQKVMQANNDLAVDWLLRLELSKTSKQPQMILGIHIELDKTMDFQLIHKKWEEMIETIPQEIKELLSQYGQNEPNIHILIGNS